MQYYTFKLIAPRPSFIADMTEAERTLMQRHGEYLRSQMAQGRVVLFGPVLDPAGAYGLAIVRLEKGEDPGSVAQGDPLIKAGVGFRYEICPMLSVVTRAELAT